MKTKPFPLSDIPVAFRHLANVDVPAAFRKGSKYKVKEGPEDEAIEAEKIWCRCVGVRVFVGVRL